MSAGMIVGRVRWAVLALAFVCLPFGQGVNGSTIAKGPAPSLSINQNNGAPAKPRYVLKREFYEPEKKDEHIKDLEKLLGELATDLEEITGSKDRIVSPDILNFRKCTKEAPCAQVHFEESLSDESGQIRKGMQRLTIVVFVIWEPSEEDKSARDNICAPWDDVQMPDLPADYIRKQLLKRVKQELRKYELAHFQQ